MSPGRVWIFLAMFVACGILGGSGWALDKATDIDRAKEVLASLEVDFDVAFAKHEKELAALRATEEYKKARADIEKTKNSR